MKPIFRNTLCPSYWGSGHRYLFYHLCQPAGACVELWLGLIMAHVTIPCTNNYPSLAAQIQVLAVLLWSRSLTLHLSTHCGIRTQRGDGQQQTKSWTLSGKVSQIFLLWWSDQGLLYTPWIRQSCGWQRRECTTQIWVASESTQNVPKYVEWADNAKLLYAKFLPNQTSCYSAL